MSRISLFPRQSRLSRAVRAALAILALGAAASAWAAGTAAGEATASPASASGPAPLVITVQPGQSLNDIAIAATQSHDPGVLARAGRALFDANPQAFMKRDPSRLKVGATLTVPALDANGAALAPAGASGAAAASAAVAASAGAASMQHAASMPHGASSVASAASAASAAQRGAASGANVGAAPAGASAASAVSAGSAAHGASFVAGAASASSAAAAVGASGPHMWSGAIQSAPSSASDAAAQPAPGAGTRAASEPVGAAPVAAASQPRPSSLQQLLALKNRVLMELQKHGIGKPAATNAVAPAPAPVAPRSTPGEAGASAAVASPASAAASDVAASAVQPASASQQAAAPVVTPPPANRAEQQVDWRPASLAGAAVVVLAAGFLLRKRRKARQADAAATSAAAGGGAAGAAVPEVEQELPIQPEMPVARDAAADMTLAAATAAAAETVAPPDAEAAPSSPEAAEEVDAAHTHLPPADAELPQTGDASVATHDAKPAEVAEPTEAPVVPPATDAQHAALMQNAITALGSLDMPLPPRTPGESSLAADESGSPEDHLRAPQIATNGQAATRPPIGAADPAPEHPADHDDELEWDPDDAPSRSSAPSSLPPLGGAQFGALKLDFDLDLPPTPGAVLPALTPEELARIARNKLDLAAEYVELGDLSGARTLLQEVVDANDAATRDDARALLAKLADEA
ncbi:FimV/HubP family polar landmark protein [Burkholderia pseudomultivorans]|uniref:FimV/HubP family polar landmark protein n=1 Tax=Burkholderia pseudomultivorans TaxID=1207504 RepID=UPI00075BCD07|nr:FimV/HubP family polar landmark protein [Burkholderia pseudomultivorans]KWF06502.1 pilus assembly protein FimV [Burkholderia pseudomultivorans]